ncbi:hypothetical protein D3C81_1772340 [compost metagenome]
MLTNAGKTKGEGTQEWRTMLLTHFPCLIPGVRQRGNVPRITRLSQPGETALTSPMRCCPPRRACVCGSTVRRWAGTV